MKNVKFLPDAEEEMYEAARYYQAQAPGLGAEYLSEVERAVLSIAKAPLTWPKIEGELRRRIVRRFPFGILKDGVASPFFSINLKSLDLSLISSPPKSPSSTKSL